MGDEEDNFDDLAGAADQFLAAASCSTAGGRRRRRYRGGVGPDQVVSTASAPPPSAYTTFVTSTMRDLAALLGAAPDAQAAAVQATAWAAEQNMAQKASERSAALGDVSKGVEAAAKGVAVAASGTAVAVKSASKQIGDFLRGLFGLLFGLAKGVAVYESARYYIAPQIQKVAPELVKGILEDVKKRSLTFCYDNPVALVMMLMITAFTVIIGTKTGRAGVALAQKTVDRLYVAVGIESPPEGVSSAIVTSATAATGEPSGVAQIEDSVAARQKAIDAWRASLETKQAPPGSRRRGSLGPLALTNGGRRRSTSRRRRRAAYLPRQTRRSSSGRRRGYSRRQRG